MSKAKEVKPLELTATNLKAALWSTLQDVKVGTITPAIANSVATQSREIVRIINTEIRIETNKSISKKTRKFLR